MRYSTVFFDLYGTLADVSTDEEGPATWERFRQALAGYGAVYADAGSLKKAFHAGVDALFAQIAEGPAVHGGPSSVDCAHAQDRLPGRDDIRAGAADDDSRWPDPDLSPVFSGLLEQKGVSAPVDSDLVRRAGAEFRLASLRRLRLYPGVKQLLARLRQAGIRTVLLSNAQRLYTAPELDRLGLWDFLDAVFISSDFGSRKPAPAFFRHALEKAGADPASTLMVGNDAASDIAGATMSGLDSAYLFTSSWPGNDRFPLGEATYNFRGADYNALFDVIVNGDGTRVTRRQHA